LRPATNRVALGQGPGTSCAPSATRTPLRIGNYFPFPFFRFFRSSSNQTSFFSPGSPL
jgi:hypothetical protein